MYPRKTRVDRSKHVSEYLGIRQTIVQHPICLDRSIATVCLT